MDATEIARRFGLGKAATLSDEPVARGKQGVVWRLQTSDGSWAVKQPFGQVSEPAVRSGAAFQEAAYAAGIPTPRNCRTTGGSVFAAIDGSPVRVYEWVDLRGPDPHLDPARVGALVAAMHQVAVPEVNAPEVAGHHADGQARGSGDRQVDAWYHVPVGAARWDELIARLRAAGAPFADRLAGLRDELVGLESWLEPPRSPRICHRDLWADNVLPTADGGICVVDFENSGPADPAHELGCVLFEFGRTDPGRARALVGAYRDAGGPARFEQRGDFTMLIAQLGHITETAAEDWLAPNLRSPDRADAAAWIAEVLDEPHTRDLLQTLLTAVRER
ncbi:MAG: phosphotransferase enzyme family protein [Micromonosporaceae bacterium]